VVAAHEVRLRAHRLPSVPNEDDLVEHDRNSAGLLIELWALLDVNVQVRPQRATRVPDRGDLLADPHALSLAHPRASSLEVRQHGVAPGTTVTELEDDVVAISGPLPDLADGLVGVEVFRRDVFGGQIVSASNASSLIRSPATSILPLVKFKRANIPTEDHEAELLWIEESVLTERPYEVHGELKIMWAEGEKQVPFSWKGSRPLRSLPFWDGEKKHLVRAWRGSVIDELHDVATKLARAYPWEPPFAAWFILTDEAPWVPPLTAQASGPDTRLNHGSITITAAHWVPKEVVSKFYADVKARTNPAPTPSMRRLALFRFVVQCSRGVQQIHTVGLETPRWRPLLRMWNEEHPAGDPWHYGDVRNFRRDFLEAFRSLVNPFRK